MALTSVVLFTIGFVTLVLFMLSMAIYCLYRGIRDGDGASFILAALSFILSCLLGGAILAIINGMWKEML